MFQYLHSASFKFRVMLSRIFKRSHTFAPVLFVARRVGGETTPQGWITRANPIPLACIHASRSYFVDNLLECFLGRVVPYVSRYFPAGNFSAWRKSFTEPRTGKRPAPLENLFHASALGRYAHSFTRKATILLLAELF